MQGNHIQSTPCVFSLQPSLCAWKYHIWPFRGTPRTHFSNFPSFGTPRKLVSWNFEASGLPRRFIFSKNNSSGHPETLFFRISTFRDAPKPHFPRFSLVACKRNAVFSNFWWKNTSDGLFFAFFAFRSRATNDFQHFLAFPRGGKSVLAVISFSLARENRFLLFSCFPS